MYKYLSSVKQIFSTNSLNHFIITPCVESSSKHNIYLKQCRKFNLYYTNNSRPWIDACQKRNAHIFNSSNILQQHILLRNFSFVRFKSVFTDKDLEGVGIKYPNPKNILNNYYTIVSNELKSSFQLIPQYKIAPHKKGETNREWTCTYNVKWPEETKVSGTAPTKAEASTRAALRVLYLLEQAGKILNNGQPVIYDKDTFNRITKRTYQPLLLDAAVEMKLREVCDIYDSSIKQHIENNLNDDSSWSEELAKDLKISQDASWRNSLSRQRCKSLSTYFAKESVELPIQAHRKELETLLDTSRIIIIRGEAGCGKSTRVPQYVLEHWVNRWGRQPVKVLVTQPRRIAAISLAERVAHERNEQVGDVVGYQVRLRSNFNAQSGRILYCTTGILLRQLQCDPSLQQCTHVIIDEAHERDVNTDLLLNLLRRAQQLNPALQLIIMSATIDVTLFRKYFNGAPVMEIPGFTYPVQMHFLDDIPLGLRQTREACRSRESTSPAIVPQEVAEVIKWIHDSKAPGAVLCFLPGWDEISRVRRELERRLDRSSCWLLALHSKLSDEDQKRIFGRPPPGLRKVILATNIAETSVTVDDVVYVVDSGVHREPRYDSDRGLTCMDTHWFEAMAPFSMPEILRVSLTKIVLDAKVYSGDIDAIEFFEQLPCPPEDGTVLRAVDELRELELLNEEEHVTPLGRVVSEFQLPPKLSRAMVQSVMYKCVTPLVDIATLFSGEGEIFSTALQDKLSVKQTKESVCPTSDHISLVVLFESWLSLIDDEEFETAARFCTKNNLVPYKLNTLRRLQDVHFEYLEKHLRKVMDLSDEFADNEELIKGVLLSGVGNVLMQRDWDIVKGRLKSAEVHITRNGQKATITPDSVNSKKKQYKSPFFVYINETRSVIRRTNLIRDTSLINPLTLLLFKHGELIMKKSHQKENNEEDNNVILQIRGTKLEFLCSKRQASVIKMCQSRIRNIEKYLINQFTIGGQECSEVLDNWDRVLNILNEILQSEK